MALVIKNCTVTEILSAPNIQILLDAYSAESSIKSLPPTKPNASLYSLLERAGAISIIAAYIDEILAGFAILLCSESPHYSAIIGTTESLFVLPEYRGTGAGIDLLKAVELRAKEKGAVGFLISSPAYGRLATILPNIGYHETNRVFFKGFANE